MCATTLTCDIIGITVKSTHKNKWYKLRVKNDWKSMIISLSRR